ncbi:MAG: T9SS type A sorting domain-containing protein [Bacteroidales bacterium]|jgi:hypothetical protein|nr:T9SS type A sorting domain-containing protein [Bacteroidales bacterium]HOE58871.1 T9SS type A sorting domain-containing protein [Bacteroidales bacterium]
MKQKFCALFFLIGTTLAATAQQGGYSLKFDGTNDYVNVPDNVSLNFGTNPFTIEAWVKSTENTDNETDQLGDIITKFDQSNKKGFNLGFLRQSAHGSQSNYRNLYFGIDNNHLDISWVEKASQAGNTEQHILSLVVYNGKLFGGTGENGMLYEWNGIDAWVQKAPKLNDETEIISLAVYNGKLYGGTNPNGKLYEWNDTDAWVEKAAKLGDEIEIFSLAVYNGKLYGGTYPNGSLYEWNGTDAWVEKASQAGGTEQFILSLAIYNGKLYGGTYPNGSLYEWNGTDAWVEKAPKLSTETFIGSLAVYNGKLYGGTYPNGKLYEWNGADAWVEKASKLGDETEITSLAVYNGKLYGGTAPNGKLYEWNGIDAWVEKAVKLADENDIRSLAVYNGKLYGGTSPNSRLYEWKTGVSISYDYQFSNGWQHVAVVREATSLKMYINGVLVNTSDAFTQGDYDLSNTNNLLIGFGQQDFFKGTMDEIRVWNLARTQDQINENMYRELTGSETGLVAYYKMSNGSGSTLSDNKSGGTNTGTINGATWTASGALSGSKMALDFDGSDDQVQFQSNSPAYNNTALTIEAWMKSTNAGENKELVSWGDASGSNIVEFKMDEGKLKFGINVSSAESVWGSQAINTGKWVHVAVVKDNSSVTLYVNGVVDATGTLTQSPSVNVMTIANLYQNGTYSTTNLFSGMLDEVRIWNTARTKSQIRESMMKTLEGNEDGLIAYYRFDHYGGTTLYDISGHGKNGTLTNMDAATDWVSSDAFNTWLGGESNEWSTAANWSNGAPSSDQSFGIYDWSSTLSGVTTVPSFPSTLSVNNLRIPSGITPSGSLGLTADGSVLLGSDLTLSTSTVGKLMIENGGSITLPTGATLTVNNQLNIESDATGTGSFIIHGTMSGSGTFNVERYIEGRSWSTTPIYWHLLSSPVQDQEISAFETTGTGNDYGFYGWSEIHNLWINYKNTSNPPTFSEWNDGTNFVQGRGYLVSYEQTQSGKKFTGTPYNTDKTWSNLSYSSGSNYGWHLLGNPFPSALKWNESTYWALSNVAGTAKIWHCTNNAYSDINSNGIIPISQGFMIQVNGANNSITIPLASRVHNNTAWYKAGDANRLLLVASPTDGSSAQESVIRIEEGSTNDFDFYYDSRFLAGYAPLFYCIVGNEILSTQAVPSIEEGMEFLYGFIKNDRQEFKIRLAENPFPMRVYLEDLKTGVTQCLSDNPEYVFTSVEGDAHNRFKLHMGSVGIDEPNPTKVFAYAVGKQLYFTFGGEKRVEIFNTAGQMLMHLTTAQNQIPLPLSSGIYIVRITTDQQTVFNKIFIRK